MNGAPKGSIHRELKTVLFADVAGYARLTESNEERTHRNLCIRYRYINNLIHHHKGVTHRTEGDSLLATFSSPSHALQCAIDIQNSSSEHNESLNKNEILQFRVGINCGEVIVDNGEAFGNCVNIAKRLESIAKPGEIVFSESFFSHVHQALPYRYKYLGKRKLKNLHKAVKIYGVNPSHTRTHSNFIPSFIYNKKKPVLNISTLIALAFFLFITNNQINVSDLSPINKDRNLVHYSDIKQSQRKLSSSRQAKTEIHASKNLRNTQLLESAEKKLLSYEKHQQKLLDLHHQQQSIITSLKQKNKHLITQQEQINAKFRKIETQLKLKHESVTDFEEKNLKLIEANRTLLSKLDQVVTQQTLKTYESLYAEYNPVRQQIIDIIESQPKINHPEEDEVTCSIYSNESVKPHTLANTKGATRKELFCSSNSNKDAPIPQSKMAVPAYYAKKLLPKEKKVVVYAYIPKLPHQSNAGSKSINENVAALYKKALSDSSLQAYKTDFVLLSPPSDVNDFTKLDSEHCDVYGADHVASIRLNQSHTALRTSSSLVVHNCDTNSIIKRETRYLLSDSWKNDDRLYLSPSTLDSFNLQVNSIVDLALNKISDTDLEL